MRLFLDGEVVKKFASHIQGQYIIQLLKALRRQSEAFAVVNFIIPRKSVSWKSVAVAAAVTSCLRIEAFRDFLNCKHSDVFWKIFIDGIDPCAVNCFG